MKSRATRKESWKSMGVLTAIICTLINQFSVSQNLLHPKWLRRQLLPPIPLHLFQHPLEKLLHLHLMLAAAIGRRLEPSEMINWQDKQSTTPKQAAKQESKVRKFQNAKSLIPELLSKHLNPRKSRCWAKSTSCCSTTAWCETNTWWTSL